MLLYIEKPKFRFENSFLKFCCQSYLAILKGFFITKKAIIAYISQIISIFKPRPNNTFLSAKYNYIKDHILFFL